MTPFTIFEDSFLPSWRFDVGGKWQRNKKTQVMNEIMEQTLPKHHSDLSFEEAYREVEQLLLRINDPACTLEESLTFFERADLLLRHCQDKLIQAEKKVELLLKRRDGTLLLEENKPQMRPFETEPF